MIDKKTKEKFWSRVDVQDEDSCWSWKGGIKDGIWGAISINRRTHYAHRVLYEIHYGSIPKGKTISHLCGNRLCMNIRHLKLSDVEFRFWNMVNVRGDDDCWEWTAYKNKDGYGRITIEKGVKMLSHRFSWEKANNQKIPDGLIVMHSCDNPPCVNPNHLSVGSCGDNNKDKMRKGRCSKISGSDHPLWGKPLPAETRQKLSDAKLGEKHNLSKTNDSEVREIRRLYKTGRYTQKELGKMFGLSRPNISSIVLRKTWTHVE